MRQLEFMKMLNDSFPIRGLTCSLQDHQLSEYLQIKKGTHPDYQKKLRSRVSVSRIRMCGFLDQIATFQVMVNC